MKDRALTILDWVIEVVEGLFILIWFAVIAWLVIRFVFFGECESTWCVTPHL